MKTKTRLMAVLLAVLMIACLLPTTVFAAETPELKKPVSEWPASGGTIAVTASNGDDAFELYKIVDIEYNETTNQVTYAFTPKAAAILGSTVTIDAYKAYDSTQAANLLGSLASQLKAGNVAADATVTASGGDASFSNLGMGQYLVLGAGSSTGVYVYQPMTASFVPDAELMINTRVDLSSKSSAPSVVKEIKKSNTEWVEKKDVAVGEVVTYRITAATPVYPAGATNKTFTITDTLPAGLDYVADSASIAPTSVEGKTLTWEIDLDTYTESTVAITYDATVSNAIIAAGSMAANDAELTYGFDPYGTQDKTITDTTVVYAYGIEIEKVDASNANTKLASVEFDVYKGTDATGTKVGTITTNRNGIAELDGLALGTYYIKETKAATGYVLPADGVTITLTDADLDGALDGDTDGVASTQITNTKGNFVLPQTGGMGTWVFTIGGLVLMAGAVVLLLVMRKKKESQN